MNTAEEIKIFRLEDRILFEAAAAAEVVDAVQNADASVQEQNAEEKNSQDISNINVPFENNNANAENIPAEDPADIADVDAELDALIDGIIPQGENPEYADEAGIVNAALHDNGLTISSGRELVVINSSVNNIDSVLENIKPDQDVLILSERNGLAELNEYLDKSDIEYSAIHFVTHGNSGELSINGELINNDSFDAAEWESVGEHLTSDGDIYFYGCNVAENADGQILIDRIAAASDADVAASDDFTGKSGDWDLEYVIGSVSTEYICVADYNWDLTVITAEDDLQVAVDAAANAGGNVTIEVGDITFENGVEGIFDEDLELKILGVDDAVFSGGNSFEIFNFSAVYGITANITIDSIAFENGETAISGIDINLSVVNSSFSGFTDSVIYLDNNTLNIENSEFINNMAEDAGSAINTGACHVIISKTHFSGNKSTGQRGGTVYVADGNLTITDSSFDNNSADDSGGAIVFEDGTEFSVSNSTFYKNTAGTGGAIRLFGTNYTASITDSTFTGNTANIEGSNAVFNGEGTLTIDNTLLVSNGTNGDLWQATSGGSTTVTNSMITAIHSDSGTVNAGGQVNAEYTADKIFAAANLDDLYKNGNHTLALNPFHQAAWSGADAAAGAKDQLGNDRNAINSVLGITGMYSIGAVTAKAGIVVTPEDYAETYSGSDITVNPDISVKYADDTTVVNKSVESVKITPGTVKNAGTYTINVSDIDFADIDESALDIKYKTGNLTVEKATLTVSVGSTTISKKYDGNNSVETSDISYEISGFKGNDSGNVSSADWEYNDVNAADNIGIIVENIVLDSSLVANYTWNTTFRTDGAITARDVTITSGSNSWGYDGTAHSEESVTITGDGFVNGEGGIASDFKTVTNVSDSGDNNNTFVYALTTGTSAQNYNITYVYGDLSITAKTVDITFSTDEPYYYDGTDQSGTVNATYIDINGNTVNAVINWNGATFKDPGTYTVTVESNDGNYVIAPADAEKTLVMQEAVVTPAVNAPIYSEGNYPGFSSNADSMTSEIVSDEVQYNTQSEGNFSTLRFSDLIRCTMLDHLYENDKIILKDFKNTVSVDALKYRPMEIDNITSDISEVIGNSKISHPHSLFVGEEIFIGSNYNETESDNAVQLRGNTYSYDHEAIVIEKDYHLEDVDVMTYSIAVNNLELPASVFAHKITAANEMPSEYDITGTVHEAMTKITNFKSDVEKLIDNMLG